MKKLIFAFALMVSAMFMSCTGNTNSTEAVETTDSIEVVVDSIAVDTVAVDTLAVNTVPSL